MNLNAVLTKRENEVTKLIAWGATKKDVANILNRSIRTIENTCRNIFEKTGVTKVNELSAWFFCHEFNISLDFSPLKQRVAALSMFILVLFEIFNFNASDMRGRKSIARVQGRKAKTEQRIEA